MNESAVEGTSAQSVEEPTGMSTGVRRYCLAVFAVGTAAGVALLVGGAAMPPIAPVLLFGMLFLLYVNRFTLFPSELAMTAEEVLTVFAIVAFRRDAPYLGPWCVALLAGPLDLVHWRHHAFARMAYNVGNKAIAGLVGALAFAAIERTWGTSTPAMLLGAVVVATVCTIVDFALTAGLVDLLGEPRPLRHALVLVRSDPVLGVIGAAAGYLATGVGWWAAALLVVPLALLPDRLARRRRRTHRMRRAMRSLLGPTIVVVLLAGAVIVAVCSPSAASLTNGVALAVFGVMLGAELRVTGRVALPGILVIVVVPAFVLLTGLVAMCVGVAAAALAVVFATPSRTVARAWLPILGVALSVAGAWIVYSEISSGDDVARGLWRAVAAAMAFELLLVGFGSRRRVDVVWTLPVVVSAAALALVWAALGAPGIVVFAGGMLFVFAVVAWCAAPPWPSRLLVPIVTALPSSTTRRRVVVFVLACTSVGLACGSVGREGQTRDVWVLLAVFVGLLQGSVAMVVVRQWRFVSWRRACDAAVVIGACGVLVTAYVLLGVAGSPWGPVCIVGLLSALGVVAATGPQERGISSTTLDPRRDRSRDADRSQ